MKTKILALGALVAALGMGMTPEASAQGRLDISLGKHKKGKHIDVGISLPIGRDRDHGRDHRHDRDRGRGRHRDHDHGRHGRHDHRGRWIPAHYEWVVDKVWVPPVCRQVWVPPVYETRRLPCGTLQRVLVCPGRFEEVHDPGYYRQERRRVLIPGRWVR